MKRILLALLLLAGGGTACWAQVSIGVTIGHPPPPRVLRYRPPSPGPEFMWVDGYWYPVGRHYRWHQGYWTRPPYSGANWVTPRYDGREFFNGYWEGDRGRIEHDHRWDRHRERDYGHRDRDHDHGSHR